MRSNGRVNKRLSPSSAAKDELEYEDEELLMTRKDMLRALEMQNASSAALLKSLPKVSLSNPDDRAAARDIVKRQLEDLKNACEKMASNLDNGKKTKSSSGRTPTSAHSSAVTTKHYMEPTTVWQREHERSKYDPVPLAKANDRFKDALHQVYHGAKDKKWENAQSKIKEHHVAKSALREVIVKLRAASYRGTGPTGHDFMHLFKKMDTKHAGVLSYSQFAHGIRKLCPISAKDLHVVFDEFDADGSGTVDYLEFLKKLKGENLITEEDLMSEDDRRARMKNMQKKKKIDDDEEDWVEHRILREHHVSSDSPHYMQETPAWKREHDMSKSAVKLCSGDEARWEATLHDASHDHHTKWVSAKPHGEAHHIADSSVKEVIMKFRSAAYGPNGQDYEKLFRRLDSDRDGVLSHAEFRKAAKRYAAISEKDLRNVFRFFDRNHDRKISYAEFLSAVDDGSGKKKLISAAASRSATRKPTAQSQGTTSGIASSTPSSSSSVKRTTPVSTTRGTSSKKRGEPRIKRSASPPGIVEDPSHWDKRKIVEPHANRANDPHFMEPTDNWTKEHGRSKKRSESPLASAEHDWEESLHGDHHLGGWHLSTPHGEAHHIADSALKEIIFKLRQATYGRGGKVHGIRALFKEMDSDHDGYIDFEEFEHVVKSHCPLSRDKILRVFQYFDAEEIGKISFPEFVEFLQGPTLHEPLKARTRALDRVRNFRSRRGSLEALRGIDLEAQGDRSTFGSSPRPWQNAKKRSPSNRKLHKRHATRTFKPYTTGEYWRHQRGWSHAGVKFPHNSPSKTFGEYWEEVRKEERKFMSNMRIGVYKRLMSKGSSDCCAASSPALSTPLTSSAKIRRSKRRQLRETRRDEKTAEDGPPPTPIRQWIESHSLYESGPEGKLENPDRLIDEQLEEATRIIKKHGAFVTS